MIIGIGVDIVDVSRFEALSQRQPTFLDRILTESERLLADGKPRGSASLAARFAAKEAVAKALGGVAGLSWHDCVVSVDISGRPSIEVQGSVAVAAEKLGITAWHVSLTHDGGNAIAYVIAEG